MWLYTGYQEPLVRMDNAIARTHMKTFVPARAAACATGRICIRNGGEGMNCSQNSTPVTKKLACISQMATAWLVSPSATKQGTCQASIRMVYRATRTHD